LGQKSHCFYSIAADNELIHHNKRIIQMNQDKLTIRDFPISLWIMGLVLLGVTAYLVTKAAYPTAGITGVLGLLALFLPSTLTVSADRATRILTLRYGLVIPRSVKQIPFDEIDTIRVDSSTTRNNDSPTRRSTTYRLELVKKDGTNLPFRSFYSGDFLLKQRRAEKLRTFIGLAETVDETPIGILRAMPQIVQPAIKRQQEALTGGNQQIRETNGVHWELQSVAMGAAPVTRWFSPDYKMDDGFLYLAQKMVGQQSGGGGFLASIGKTLFRTSIGLYGFAADDTPGLDTADTISPLDANLEPYFTAFTGNPIAARQILNPWAAAPLRSWAERYPMRQLQQGRFGQLVILFSPNGVYLATLNLLQPDQVDELAALGVELVKTQGGAS
jgi:hypothetical protein